MSKVFIEEATLTGIADAIRDKEGSEALVPVTQMAERIGALGGGGLELERQALEIRFPSLNVLEAKEATINLDKANNLLSLFNASAGGEAINTTVEHITINCPNEVKSIGYMANGGLDKTLKKITLNVDTSKAQSVSYAFASNYVLEIIDGTPLDFSSVTSSGNMSNPFHLCYELKEVRFKGTIKVSIPVRHTAELSKDSIESITSCLSTEATDQTLTLSLTAVNAAFETSPGAADGSTSAEWMALVDSKPNWTIALV